MIRATVLPGMVVTAACAAFGQSTANPLQLEVASKLSRLTAANLNSLVNCLRDNPMTC